MLIADGGAEGGRNEERDKEGGRSGGERERGRVFGRLQLVINNADYNLRIILAVPFLLIFIAQPSPWLQKDAAQTPHSALN